MTSTLQSQQTPTNIAMRLLPWVYCLCFALASPSAVRADIIPWDKDTEDPSLINMGPIGARVKTDHLDEESPDSESSAGIVRYIFENSLAEGKLEIGDEVIGGNGEAFDENFSRRLAEAIDWSEGNSGVVSLDIIRDEQPQTIEFELEKIGSFGDTWPYECEKSSRILRNACDWLVAHQLENGRLEGAINGAHFVLSSIGGLCMLGCDLAHYQKSIEAIVEFLIDELESNRDEKGHYIPRGEQRLELWSLNYAAIFLSEYYLVTGDERVSEVLEFLNQEIYYRQFHQLDEETAAHLTKVRTEFHQGQGRETEPPLVPPYWFAHGLVTSSASGYIHLGVNVANACAAWSLLSEAGADVDLENLSETMDYIEEICPGGSMAYGGTMTPASVPAISDSFGRTGVLAIAYALQNRHEEEHAEKVANSLSLTIEKETYFKAHGTAVMGKSWGSLGLAALSREDFREVMDHYRYSYTLNRLSEGSFVYNPIMAGNRRDLLVGKDEHRWTTACTALLFTLAEGSLRIAGRPPSESASGEPAKPMTSTPATTTTEPTTAEPFRIWTYRVAGAERQVEARLTGISSGTIQLERKADGKKAKMETAILSPEDQGYVDSKR